MQVQPDGSVIVPAGEYILGDPCYAVPDDSWAALLDSCDCFDESTPVGSVLGHKVLAFRTACGDGCYVGSDSFGYWVDSGIQD